MPSCTACTSTDTRRDPFYYVWREREWWIQRCRSCSHQFVHPSVGPEEQATIYADSYFAADGDWVCGIFGAGYEDAEQDLITEADEVLDLIDVREGTLLDIGCAGGTFLDRARARGFGVQGLELNETMARYARDTYCLDVLCSRIEDVPDDQWRERFDVVTLLDVLEHVPEPLDALRKVQRWLRPGGRLMIRGPMVTSRVAVVKEAARRILGATKLLDGYPLDANAFNRRSMTAMLEAAGFEWGEWWPKHNFANVLAVRR